MATELDLDNTKNRRYAIAVYVLQSLAFIGILFTPIMGVVLNYIKADDVKGTWLESHFAWQKNTFWYGLLWFILGSLSFPIIGWMVILFSSIWYFYRIAKGWISLSDGKEMYL